MLEHGGNLRDAVLQYGRPYEEWLDLSTGINPHPYPVPALSADCWHRLPEPSDTLIDAARRYYQAVQLLPVAGTQAAIQALPRLRARSRVVLAEPSYAEHAHHWQQNGHQVRVVPFAELPNHVDECDVMVICNPNNPTGERLRPSQLLNWADRLAQRQGWLVVDEAFGDVEPELSVADAAFEPGLIVLKSVGKFFGLAGLRLGFVAAHGSVLGRLADMLGPWTVSGPAQQIGIVALSDVLWQDKTRAMLQEEGKRMRSLLAQSGITASGCALFHYWAMPDADLFSAHLAEQGIWVRTFDHGIRIGLPANEQGWHRLEAVLQQEWKCVS